MAKNISNLQIWRKIIDKFNDVKLRYVLVGAAALVIHGLPRSTIDIDIYIPAKKDVLDRLFEIAKALNLHTEQTAILNIKNSPKLFVNQWLCFSYNGQDILDVFLADKDEFDRIYKNSEIKKDDGFSVRVASLADIKAMKKASGRPIDVADIESIEEIDKYKK